MFYKNIEDGGHQTYEKNEAKGGRGVCNFTCFIVTALNKNSANIFNLVFKAPEVKSPLILHDELFKMPCEI